VLQHPEGTKMRRRRYDFNPVQFTLINTLRGSHISLPEEMDF